MAEGQQQSSRAVTPAESTAQVYRSLGKTVIKAISARYLVRRQFRNSQCLLSESLRSCFPLEGALLPVVIVLASKLSGRPPWKPPHSQLLQTRPLSHMVSRFHQETCWTVLCGILSRAFLFSFISLIYKVFYG